jgi:phosphoserine phosphatase
MLVFGNESQEEIFMSAAAKRKLYLLASDFDHTLSFNDSGLVLSELLGVSAFEEKVRSLERLHLVQQGGELAYLLLHDPDFRDVRPEHLRETGRRIRLKKNIPLLIELLRNLDGAEFDFHVISAAPQEVIHAALDGIIPPENIHGTLFETDAGTGRISAIRRVSAGYGKVAVLEEIRQRLGISYNRLVYVGDGSSDVHVMLHLNRNDGLTIAVSENRFITQIARRTVLSDDALSVAVPVMEEIFAWDSLRVRAFFELHGVTLREWTKVRTDRLSFAPNLSSVQPPQ